MSVEGPFGSVLPGSSEDPELWIAGGAGVTPFLSVLRTAADRTPTGHAPVHFVLAAASAGEAPCWDEITTLSRSLPWLTVQPAFTTDGGRLTPEALDALAANADEGTRWYVCGPPSLVEAAKSAYTQAPGDPGLFHSEAYSWR